MTETQSNFCRNCGAPRSGGSICLKCFTSYSSASDPTEFETVDENYSDGGIITDTLEKGVRRLTERQEKKCKLCGTSFEYYVLAGDTCPRCREEAKRAATIAQQKAEYDRIRVISFNSQGEYNGWLRRVGGTVEIIDTTASKRHGLFYSGTIHKTTFTVTYKLRQPPSMQPAHPQVVAPTPPQQPVMDIPEQIEKLAKLKEQGILTEDEFQSKKQELLSRL
jgi:Short C-terminal domain